MTGHPTPPGVLLAAIALGCASPPPAVPSPAPAAWNTVTRLLDSLVAAGAAPGAVLGVSIGGGHRFYGTGRLGMDDATRPDSATVYDLASLTKVVSLTSLMLQAVDEGVVRLDLPVARYVPEFAEGPDSARRNLVTIRHLLTHASGLPAWRPLYQETTTRAEALALVDSTPLDDPPGARFVYSDLGAMVLTQVIERTWGTRIDTLFNTRIAQPLHLFDTRYLPPREWLAHTAPTEDDPWRGRVLRGEVHDENAARLDGASGHAGLFGSARDLITFADWLIGEWEQGDGATLRDFARRQDLPPGSSRALGWDTPSDGSSGGTLLSSASFGHTGFTGTSIWIDPTRRLAIVLLSNRVHPTRRNTAWAPVRALIADRVVRAMASDSVTR